MKKLVVLGVIALSSLALAKAAPKPMGALESLDAEFQNLIRQEEARFNQEKAQADAARTALAKNEEAYNLIASRAEALELAAETSFYKDQYEKLSKKYNEALGKLEKDMDVQRRIIEEFEAIAAIRGAAIN